ncbi:MAG TPA: SIS domain-containing protein [bacterium]|nr:SIS domain-containing protein [bacterium]
MQPRLQKYQQFIEKEYLASLIKNKDYSLANLKPELRQKVEQGSFKRIVFIGMGASAIVAEMLKGFFIEQKVALPIEVINDYDLNYVLDNENLKNQQTLFILNSFSGNSVEPLKVYEQIKKVTKNIIFLTTGGEMAKIAQTDKVSLISWQLQNPNEIYSVLHVPQFFVILLDIFYELKIIKSNYQAELIKTVADIKKEFTGQKITQVRQIAKKLKDRELIFLATPKWYLMLLKVIVMHLNELALVSAHINSFHEFTHCEIAVFSSAKNKLGAVILADKSDDQYTKDKIKYLVKILGKQNKNSQLVVIKMEQADFFKKFFSTLLLAQYLAYFLGLASNLEVRELVSTASGKFKG